MRHGLVSDLRHSTPYWSITKANGALRGVDKVLTLVRVASVSNNHEMPLSKIAASYTLWAGRGASALEPHALSPSSGVCLSGLEDGPPHGFSATCNGALPEKHSQRLTQAEGALGRGTWLGIWGKGVPSFGLERQHRASPRNLRELEGTCCESECFLNF